MGLLDVLFGQTGPWGRAIGSHVPSSGAAGLPPGLLDQLTASQQPSFDQALAPKVDPVDDTGDAERARAVAAERLRRGVKHGGRPLIENSGIEFPGLMAGGVGMLSGGAPAPAAPWQGDPAGGDLPPSTNDPMSGEPQVFKGGVPLPRPRPASPGQMTDASSQSTGPLPAPLSIAPPVPPAGGPQPPAAPGGGFSLGNFLRPENAPLLLSLAGGFAGAPSIGTGMRRAFSGAVPPAMQMRKEQLATANQGDTYRALIQRGVPPVEAIAAIRNPDVLKATISKYFETKPAQIVNDRLVREKPGGGVEVLADFSDAKSQKAPAGYEWSGDTLKFIKGGPADPEVKRTLGERQNAPPGYAWVDPADPEKGLKAIPGGPAEKVDANVAARLGVADAFLAQLPSIRKRVNAGDVTGPFDAAMAKLNLGEQGEIRRHIQSGSEALLRNLTGAGMNMTEAQKYVQRYEVQPTDTVFAVNSKLDQLERELRATMESVQKGRGGASRSKATSGAPPAAAAPVSGRTSSGISYSIVE